MSLNIDIKAHNVFKVMRHLDDSAVDYEYYEKGSGVVTFTINETDPDLADTIGDELKDLDIG